ncbi:MAG: sugar phosphate isomerase/epimerase, partial [Planctomycetes bacterium]|nr:sugar phosphate isomerase/epimerase [Planctomycetota bacterium]
MNTTYRPTRRKFLQQSTISIGCAASALAAVRTLAAEAGFRGKFAICNETFGDWPFEKAFQLAAECGYQAIEIAPYTIANNVNDISAARRSEVRRQIESAGLQVTGLHWMLSRTEGLHLTSPDGDVRKKTAEYLGALARFCADVGGKVLVFGSPQQRNLAEGVSREQGLEYAVEVFSEALPIVEQTDTLLAIEPLSVRTTNFIRTAAEGADLVGRVASPRFRMILDCLAMASESIPMPELIRTHHKRMVHFHANDPNRQGPGFGELDFVPIFQALRDVEYDRWVSVEVFDYTP